MNNQEKIDKFYSDVDRLGLKFPVAMISEATGYGKGTVSSYLNRKIEPSESFVNTFYEKFQDSLDSNPEQSFIEKRRNNKLIKTKQADVLRSEGVPIYDVPIDASFLERVHDSKYFEPMYFINIPKLRNCNFGAIVSGSSMYPIMKSGSIAMCRLVEDLNYFDPGEMYLLATTNGFETVKYVQQGEEPDELLLIPHNDKIRPTTIKKSMIIRMCIVEAWLNFR